MYGKIIFEKVARNMQWRKESLSNKRCWETWKATCKIIKLNYSLLPCPKIKLIQKSIKDLNIQLEIISYVEENISTKLWTLVLEGFYELNPNVKGNKGKKKWMGLYQTQKLLQSKRNFKKSKNATNQMGDDAFKQQLQQRVNT